MSITIEVSVDCFDKYGGLTNQNQLEHLKIVSFVAKNEKKSFWTKQIQIIGKVLGSMERQVELVSLNIFKPPPLTWPSENANHSLSIRFNQDRQSTATTSFRLKHGWQLDLDKKFAHSDET